MREFKVYTKICTWIFIAAFFLIAPNWEWHRGPSVGEGINKLWYIHIMEHYSATKRNTQLIHTTTWINLHRTLLSEKANLMVTYFMTLLWKWIWVVGRGQRGDGLEKAMAPHSSTLAWKIPWMEEPGGLPSMGSHRVGHDWSNLAAAKRRWIRKEVGIAMKGQQEGSLWWWKSFLSWLYQCHYPAGDIVPFFCKIFPLGETG